ncbi:MAG: hypothetical protein AB7S74_09740 [Hyphomicrobium sp.]
MNKQKLNYEQSQKRGDTIPAGRLFKLLRPPHLHHQAARTISTVGGSLCDVQMLTGHSVLSTTQRYIEADVDAQKRVVDLVRRQAQSLSNRHIAPTDLHQPNIY